MVFARECRVVEVKRTEQRRSITDEFDPLPKSRRPRSRRAIVSAYDHRVGRRDDVICQEPTYGRGRY